MSDKKNTNDNDNERRTDRRDPPPQPVDRNDGEKVQIRRDCFRQG